MDHDLANNNRDNNGNPNKTNTFIPLVEVPQTGAVAAVGQKFECIEVKYKKTHTDFHQDLGKHMIQKLYVRRDGRLLNFRTIYDIYPDSSELNDSWTIFPID